MPKLLDGSCQCGAVEFSLQSNTPVPYQLCACSICRKVAGYSGSVNIGGINSTLNIKKGKDQIKKYHAIKDGERVRSERNFCSNCGTMLWLWDKEWPTLIHPFASAIDTDLPKPEEMVCIMNSSKPDWVRWPEGPKKIKETYNDDEDEKSLELWHKTHGKWVE